MQNQLNIDGELTVHNLRKHGYKVRVNHLRVLSHVAKDKNVNLHKRLTNFLISNQYAGGLNVFPRGGKTIVEIITPENRTLRGEALCSISDNFCKHTGIKLALERLQDTNSF